MYRILVVEDDAALRNGVIYALKKENYDAVAAGSLREMKEALERKIDAVLPDVSLPDGDSRNYLESHVGS